MKKRFLFCGLTTVDIQYFVDEFPGSNQKIKTNPPDICIGGPSANAAVTCSFLGGNSLFITGIGVSSFTNLIIPELEHNHVAVIDLAKGKPFSPIIASIVTTLKSSHRAIISHFPPVLPVDVTKLNSIDFSDFEMVMIDGFYHEATLEVCKRARAKGVPVLFDGGSWKPSTFELFRYIDIAICSEDFLPPGCDNALEVIQFLQHQAIDKIAITRGEKDILWAENSIVKTISVPKVASVDSLGAGDVFHGAFAWFYSGEKRFEYALEKAAATASFSTLFKGSREWMNNVDAGFYSNFL